ncbi:hypothetical protein [uncultured Hydrogenophaga sp.]|uniref:hypothetical protein n=1 Tax=uncultured Hydrogenophaga sp. TaxID=199683 RepID=UPI0025843C68|nr:hypothetical protein [uncultured Hydrogenophaga sp.]
MTMFERTFRFAKHAVAGWDRWAGVPMRRRCLESAVVAALFAWALLHGLSSMTPNWQDRTFYQYEFGPAVMLACGHGFRPAPAQKEIESFLDVKRQSLDCADVPATDAGAAVNPFQGAHRYLLQTVGNLWRVWGVDWRVADHLMVGLFALTCVLAYALLRVFLPMLWSVAGVWLYATAGTHLIYLDSLRDYAKAPFVLGVLACLAWLLKRRRSLPQELTFAWLTGCALGLGLGFRMDLLIFVPFVVGMLLVFYPAPPPEAWRNRLLISMVVLVTAYVCAYPVLSAMAKGSNTAHVILLGLSQDFGDLLGLHSADHQFASYYNDAYQQVQIDTLAGIRGHSHHLDFSSPLYEAWGYRLLGEYLHFFPADLWLRGVAAIVQGVGYDFNLRLPLAGASALIVAGLAIVGLCLHSGRLGLAFAVAVAFLFAFPALQFNLRHFFYLSIVPILCMALVARGASVWVLSLRSRPIRRPERGAGTWASLAAAATMLTAPFLVWLMLWPVQFGMQADMLRRVKGLSVAWASPAPGPQATGAPVQLTRELLSPALKARLDKDQRSDTGDIRVGYYWVIDVDRQRPGCPTNRLHGAIKYRASSAFYDFTRTFSYIVNGAVRIFLPVVEIKHKIGPTVNTTTLDALVMDGLQWDCVVRIGTAAPDASFPLLLDLVVPLAADRTHLQPALPIWMAGERPLHHTVVASPRTSAAAEMDMLQLRGIEESLVLKPTEVLGGAAVSLKPSGMRMDGVAQGRYAYLVRTDAVEFRAGDVLRVSGALEQGGLAVGLVKDGAWAHQLPVSRPGEFDLFITPAPGRYHLVIANNLARGSAVNTFEIKRLALVRPPG